MSLFSSAAHSVGNFFHGIFSGGGDSDEEKKRKQQQLLLQQQAAQRLQAQPNQQAQQAKQKVQLPVRPQLLNTAPAAPPPQVGTQPNQPPQMPAPLANLKPPIQNQPQPQPAKPNKLVQFVKSASNAVASGTRPAATVIARLLPGGQNDLKAQNDAIDAANKNRQYIEGLRTSGKITDEQAAKLHHLNNQSYTQIGQNIQDIQKTIPSQKQAAASVATMTADILSGGTYKLLENAPRAIRAGVAVAGNASAGGANAVASGAKDKKTIAENAAAGAAFPAVLKGLGGIFTRIGGRKGSQLVDDATDAQRVAGKVEPNPLVGKPHLHPEAQQLTDLERTSTQRALTDAEQQQYKQLRASETPQQAVARHEVNLEDLAAKKDEVNKAAATKIEELQRQPGMQGNPAQLDAVMEARQQYQDVMGGIDQNISNSQKAVEHANAEVQSTATSAQDAAAKTRQEQAQAAAPPEGAQTPVAGASPEASANNAYGGDTIATATEQAAEARGEKPSLARRMFNGARRELVNPKYDLDTLDRQFAATQGVKNTELTPARRLSVIHSDIQNSDTEADLLLKKKQQSGLSVQDLLHKYGVANMRGGGENSPAWAAFNQFMNQRFALEVLQKSDGKMWILNKEYSPQDVMRSVETYARENPDALHDATTVKQWADSLTDLGVQHGEIDPAFAEAIKTGYQNYVPLSRTYADDLVRPRISGGTGNSVAQQNIVRFLAGSQQPLDDSAGNLIARGRQIVKKANENRFVNELYQRQQAGVHGDRLNLQIDPNVSAYNKQVSDLYDEASTALATSRGELKDLKAAKKDTKSQVGTVKAQKTAAENQAVDKLRQMLHTVGKKPGREPGVVDPGAVNAKAEQAYQRNLKSALDENGNPIDQTKTLEQVQQEAMTAARTSADNAQPRAGEAQAFADVAPYADKLSRTQALSIIDAMKQYDPKKLRAVLTQIEKSDSKLAGLTDDVEGLTGAIDNHRSLVRDQGDTASTLWSEKTGSSQRAPTGEQVLRGFREGDALGVGIDPQLAKQLEYLTSARDDTAGKISSAVSAPLKFVATGAGAPVFAVKNKVRNELLKYINTDVRRTFGARAIGEGVRGGLFHGGQFYKDLVSSGYVAPTATRAVQKTGDSATHLAAGSTRRATALYDATHPKQWLHTLNQFGGRLDNADRVQIARGEFQHWINKGVPYEEAVKRGAVAANNALGNFQSVSKTARRLEAFTPYSGATQAGYRAIVDRYREHPVTTSLKLGSIAATIYGLTAANLQNDAAQEYYNDAVQQHRTFDLDSNFIFALPGAHKDPDGNWTGIIKVPVAPDFQPLTRTAWQAAYAKSQGQPFTPVKVAQGVASFMTADEAHTIHNTQGGGIQGWLPSSPAVAAVSIGLNINPQNGQPLGDENDLKLGYNNSTTDFAKNFSRFTRGVISPLQADAIANQQGLIGDIAQDKGGSPSSTVANAFKGIFQGSKTKSDKALDYDAFQQVRGTITDEKQQKLFDSLHSSRTLSDGSKGKSGMLDGAIRAQVLLGNEQVLKAEMMLAARDKKEGKPVNPLFDPDILTDQERHQILTYRQGKIYNSAGQNKDTNGGSAFTDLGLDEPWYQEFKDREDGFYKVLGAKDDDGVKTFSGYDKPKASDALQAKMNYYYTLSKGTGDRSAFLKANPDVLDFWGKQNDFTNAERQALGFNQVSPDGGGGGGGFGFGGSRKDFVELPSLLNLGNTPALKLGIDKKSADPNLAPFFQKLFGHGGGSSTRAKLGAASSGAARN